MEIMETTVTSEAKLGEQPKGTAFNIPKVASVHYQRNFLEKVVCELRFPTLYGLERGKPPASLANALRKEFPDHAIIDGLNITAGAVGQDFGYSFANKKRKTSVSFRSSALSIETTAYRSFEDFMNCVLFVAEAAKEAIDSDFFTRLGLRYINVMPYERGGISDWINPALVSPLASGIFGDPGEYSGRIVVADEVGGFLFQHGIGKHADSGKMKYLLDYDFWREDVDFSTLKSTMNELHEMEFGLFHWSLGKAAFNYMEQGNAKKS